MFKFIKWILSIALLIVVAFGVSWLVSMPDSEQRGIWKHEADGSILTLTRTKATLYQSSSAGCVQGLSFPAHMALVKAAEGAWIEVEGDQLNLFIDGDLSHGIFHQIEDLPPECSLDPDPSPVSTFEAMWAIMDEHYAFFDLYGVDWEQRRQFAPRGSEQMTSDELFERFRSALHGINDAHVQLISDEFGFWSPKEAFGWATVQDFERNELNQIARDTIGISLTSIDGSGLEYGLRDDGIGYVLITSMSTNPRFGQLTTTLARQSFKTVAVALRDTKAIVVDVRYNPGGDDGTAFAYAAHFTNEAVPVLSKRTRNGTGWTDPVSAGLKPVAPEHYLSQPIILLTSQMTGSGAEIFTLAMRAISTVTVMGERTSGGHSDILGTTLPNGWLFGLSNQEYSTPDGAIYEGVGIPPDIASTIDGEALSQGKDLLLQAAIVHAQSF